MPFEIKCSICLDLSPLSYWTKHTCIVLTEFMKKLVSGVEGGSDAADGDRSPASNLYPLLMHNSGGSESWNRGKTISIIK